MKLQSDILGCKAKDTLTGYEGTVTAHCTHVTGCDQVCLGGTLDKDGKPEEGVWLDVNRVEISSEGEVWVPVARPSGPNMTRYEFDARQAGACETPPRVT